MGFVFFDTETTGLRRGFDQIVHFAAIRTDHDLNEIDRFEARSRLLPYVVPHPSALLTNGLPIDRLTDSELPSHYDMVRSIQRILLSWSPSIFVGYNSIRFDEEMLRHALFQTLHSAFLTSNHKNGRADAMGLVMAAAALAPDCLSIPCSSEGQFIFRLEQLALENGIAHGEAHEAMADAAATMGLCRLVFERAPELWHRFVRFSKKATVSDFVDSEDGFVLTEFFDCQAYHTTVASLGPDPEQPNGRLCLNLNASADELLSMPDDALRSYLADKPCPVRRVRINAAPTLTAFYDASEIMLNGAIVDDLEDLARTIKENEPLCSRVISAYVATRTPRVASAHVEQQIYDRFPGPADDARMAGFHEASWQDALEIVQSFDDERLRTLGLRLVYLSARSILPEDLRLVVEHEMTDRLIDAEVGGFTLNMALDETESLLKSEQTDGDDLLSGYRDYLVDRISRVTAFRLKQFAAGQPKS